MSSNPTGREPGRLDSKDVTGTELVTQLRSTLDRAAELVRVLEGNLATLQRLGHGDATEAPAASAARVEELEDRLRTAETDVKELASRLVESEHQAGRLMNLYVATYQLHSTLYPEEVQQTIAEIAINLLGAERFVLLLRDEEADGCEVALEEGLGEEDTLYAKGAYHGGDPVVDATLEDGVLRLGPEGDSPVLAAVPLRVQDVIVGALVVLQLLDHKPILRAEDRDLLDLLSAHAASALFAARLYAAKDRKVRSLESLVKLARRDSPAG